MQLTLRPSTGLNLTLEGSIGKFRIGISAAPDNKSLEVFTWRRILGLTPQSRQTSACFASWSRFGKSSTSSPWASTKSCNETSTTFA